MKKLVLGIVILVTLGSCKPAKTCPTYEWFSGKFESGNNGLALSIPAKVSK
jgi:hypothetical protein